LEKYTGRGDHSDRACRDADHCAWILLQASAAAWRRRAWGVLRTCCEEGRRLSVSSSFCAHGGDQRRQQRCRDLVRIGGVRRCYSLR
jgi:hypothetical protein